MKARHSFYIVITAAIIGLASGVAVGGDTNIIIRQDRTGGADEVYRLNDFDYELQQRERESMRQWNIEESMGAVKVGDTYFNKGEVGEAIYFIKSPSKLTPTTRWLTKNTFMPKKLRNNPPTTITIGPWSITGKECGKRPLTSWFLKSKKTRTTKRPG